MKKNNYIFISFENKKKELKNITDNKATNYFGVDSFEFVNKGIKFIIDKQNLILKRNLNIKLSQELKFYIYGNIIIQKLNIHSFDCKRKMINLNMSKNYFYENQIVTVSGVLYRKEQKKDLLKDVQINNIKFKYIWIFLDQKSYYINKMPKKSIINLKKQIIFYQKKENNKENIKLGLK
jgi:hypothetical protein